MSVMETLGLWVVGLIATIFVLVGIVCATVVMIDEIGTRVRSMRQRRARAEAARRYRVPTQR